MSYLIKSMVIGGAVLAASIAAVHFLSFRVDVWTGP